MAVFDSEKQLIGEIEVEVSSDTYKLATQLRQNIPGSNIKVSSINGRIMLSGNASDALAVVNLLGRAKASAEAESSSWTRSVDEFFDDLLDNDDQVNTLF